MTACPVTVVILTKNEEAFIARCIASVAWADEVLVLDSESTDRTRQIAGDMGASVYVQPWLGWVGQHQAGIALARHDWILVLDADEIMTPTLRDGILSALAAHPDPRDGYVVDRRDEFFGRLFPNMKRAALRRTYVRLFNRQHSQYHPEDLIHERVVCPGRMISLPGVLLHWRSFTVGDQIERYVTNSAPEADMMQRSGVRVGALRLLLMPVLRFLWCYVYCGGFRLGTTGLVHAMMNANAEFIRHAVLWERQSVERRLHPPESVWRMPQQPAAVPSPHANAGQA
jgi:glycosyltransferase involved in cell wall biosynthesis